MNDDVIDARGLRCPLPVIALAKAAQGRPAGTVLTVLATDPAARLDVPAWARMRGHAMIEVAAQAAADDGAIALSVRLGG